MSTNWFLHNSAHKLMCRWTVYFALGLFGCWFLVVFSNASFYHDCIDNQPECCVDDMPFMHYHKLSEVAPPSCGLKPECAATLEITGTRRWPELLNELQLDESTTQLVLFGKDLSATLHLCRFDFPRTLRSLVIKNLTLDGSECESSTDAVICGAFRVGESHYPVLYLDGVLVQNYNGGAFLHLAVSGARALIRDVYLDNSTFNIFAAVDNAAAFDVDRLWTVDRASCVNCKVFWTNPAWFGEETLRNVLIKKCVQ